MPSNLWNLYKKFMTDNPRYILLNLFFLISLPILDLIIPKIYGKIFNIKKIDNSIDRTLLFLLAILMLTQTVTLLDGYFAEVQYSKFDNILIYTILSNIFKFNKDKDNNQLLTSGILNDMHRMQEITRQWIYRIRRNIIPYIIFLIVSTGYLFWKNIWLGIPMIIIIFANFLLMRGTVNGCKEHSEAITSGNRGLIELIEDLLSNILSIQSSNKEGEETEIVNQASLKVDESHYKFINCTTKWRLLGNLFLFGGLYLMTKVSISLIKSKKIPIGFLVTIFFIVRQNLQSTNMMLWLMENFSYDIITLNKVDYLLGLSEFESIKNIKKYPNVEVKFENVSFNYKDSGRKILDNVNLTVKPNDRIAIVGDIGSGKSTIVKMIMKLLVPQKGNITINNKNINLINPIELYHNIGMMPQNPTLFNRSIMDNIRYGFTNVSKEKVIKLLKEFNVYNNFSNMENGLDTIVGKNGSKLSGGQKQIVWFLRVYLKNPPLLILDEPTASLDINTKKTMSGLIESVMKNKTLIMVSHDPFLIKFAKTKYRLDKGKLEIDNSK